MRHPDEMKDECVGWHSNSALPIRPPEELISIVLKHRRPENTLFAVANRAGHHAIMATNAGRKTIQKGFEIRNDPFEFLEKGISLLCPFSDDFVDHLTP